MGLPLSVLIVSLTFPTYQMHALIPTKSIQLPISHQMSSSGFIPLLPFILIGLTHACNLQGQNILLFHWDHVWHRNLFALHTEIVALI